MWLENHSVSITWQHAGVTYCVIKTACKVANERETNLSWNLSDLSGNRHPGNPVWRCCPAKTEEDHSLRQRWNSGGWGQRRGGRWGADIKQSSLYRTCGEGGNLVLRKKRRNFMLDIINNQQSHLFLFYVSLSVLQDPVLIQECGLSSWEGVAVEYVTPQSDPLNYNKYKASLCKEVSSSCYRVCCHFQFVISLERERQVHLDWMQPNTSTL